MIRVNLLPIKEARRRSAGRMQLAIFAVILIAEIAGFVALYMVKSEQVTDMQDKVEQVRQKVNRLKSKVEETRKYEKEMEKLEQKRNTLKKIEAQSIGPGPMLRELQIILSKPRNVEERYAQREEGWNVEWDPTNLWVKTLKETDKSFTLNGRAIDADDVAEFLHRLETASHFHKVKLDYVRPAEKAEANLVEFRVTGELTYVAKDPESSNEGKSTGSDDGGKGS